MPPKLDKSKSKSKENLGDESDNRTDTNQIKDYLSVLCDTVREMNGNILKMTKSVDGLTKQLKDTTFQSSKMEETMNSSLKQVSDIVTNEIKTFNHGLSETIKVFQADTHKQTLQTKVEEHLETPQWNRKLNTRKWSYWKELKCNNKAQFYEEWLENGEEPFIPKKFRGKVFENEPEDQRAAKKDLSIYKMKVEFRLLKSRARQHREKYQQIDIEMNQTFDEIPNNETGEILKQKWTEQISKEEEHSRKKWEEKEAWFKDLEQNQLTDTINDDETDPTISKPPSQNAEHRQSTQTREREHRQRRINTNNINFSTFTPRGPRTTQPNHTIKGQNKRFFNNANKQDFRRSSRFLEETGDIQVSYDKW